MPQVTLIQLLRQPVVKDFGQEAVGLVGEGFEDGLHFFYRLDVGSAGLDFLAAVGGHVEEVIRGHFEVELKGEGRAVFEGLVVAGVGGGEAAGFGGDCESFAVPVEWGETIGEVIKTFTFPGGVIGQGHGEKADFAVAHGFDFGAEDVGDHLATEADAEDGFAGLEGGADEVLFIAKPGELVFIIDAHWSAEDKEAVEVLWRGDLVVGEHF